MLAACSLFVMYVQRMYISYTMHHMDDYDPQLYKYLDKKTLCSRTHSGIISQEKRFIGLPINV